MTDDQSKATVEQVIPASFGRFRRWWYTRYPLQDVCPLTHWKHMWDHAYGAVECPCGERGWIEYGR